MSGSHTEGDRSVPAGRASLPPRWFMVGFWYAHRGRVRVTRGRLGLWRARAGRWGALWLTTTGRRSGQSRQVLVGYFEDGDNFVTMAMNGWGASEPAWWLNVQAHPEATVRTRDGVRQVRARRAEGAQRARGCGRAGPRSTTTLRRTPRCVRARPPSWCSSGVRRRGQGPSGRRLAR
jgi:F420H(2)-dependent quinone reductase